MTESGFTLGAVVRFAGVAALFVAVALRVALALFGRDVVVVFGAGAGAFAANGAIPPRHAPTSAAVSRASAARGAIADSDDDI
jgi:hypothetical protein